MAIAEARGRADLRRCLDTAEFTLGGTSEMERRFTMEEQHRNVPECCLQKKQ